MTIKPLLLRLGQGLLCLFIFAQCTVPSHIQPTNQFSAVEVNQYYMSHRFEVFYWSEIVPTAPYIVMGKVKSTTWDEPVAITQMRDVAMGIKADGIIVKRDRPGNEFSNWTGTVIKYVRNFDDLKRHKRTVQVATYDSIADKYVVSSTAEFDLMGDRGKIQGDKEVFSNFYDYTLDHLLYEKGYAWRAKFSTEPVRIIKRSRVVSGLYTKNVFFTYRSNLVSEAKIKQMANTNRSGSATPSIVNYSYNESSQEIQRVVKCGRKKLYYTSNITLNEVGLPVTELIVRTDANDDKPLMKITYQYYNSLEQVQVVTP